MDTLEHVLYGALLHDVGKVIQRSGEDRREHALCGAEALNAAGVPKAVVDCARYHHASALGGASLPPDHPAYIVYVADNIAAGTDRRGAESPDAAGFKAMMPLSAVFRQLGGEQGKDSFSIHAQSIGKAPPEMGGDQENTQTDYAAILHPLMDQIRKQQWDAAHINSLLEVQEGYLSFIPSSTNQKEIPDISLFDHQKMTAAFAACIYHYLEEKGEKNWHQRLFQEAKAFYQEKAFAIASFDLSGIQSFIYGVIGAGALKSLRARSFYLEIMAEHIADEILSACGLTRVNLLYSGGGHAYMLLPNTPGTREVLTSGFRAVNRALREMFDTSLYEAWGMQETDANTLMQGDEDPAAYQAVFASLARQISEQKLSRYSAEDLMALNSRFPAAGERECKCCGLSDRETDQDDQCRLCGSFAEISKELLKGECLFTIEESADQPSLPLFGLNGEKLTLHVRQEKEAVELLKQGKIVRLYSKNKFRAGLNLSSKLWMGDVSARKEYDQLCTMEDFANATELNRVAVLRADVDGLGTAFVSGFGKKATLSRTAAFSRSMSIFFRYYINHVLNQRLYSLGEDHQRKENQLTVVYSGGDDVFLVGAWDEVLCAAMDLQQAFRQYTGGKLSISAGIGLFGESYPIRSMARDTGELEDAAKKFTDKAGAKDAVALFGMEYENDRLVNHHTYHWDVLKEQVIGQKLQAVAEVVRKDEEKGFAFLYRVMSLLRGISRSSPILLARLGYLLARHIKQDDPKLKQLYQWAAHDQDRRQLLTAIMLYIYTHRKAKKEENEP